MKYFVDGHILIYFEGSYNVGLSNVNVYFGLYFGEGCWIDYLVNVITLLKYYFYHVHLVFSVPISTLLKSFSRRYIAIKSFPCPLLIHHKITL